MPRIKKITKFIKPSIVKKKKISPGVFETHIKKNKKYLLLIINSSKKIKLSNIFSLNNFYFCSLNTLTNSKN